MSQLMLEESECIEKILTDYRNNVSSEEEYYLWANKKYQNSTMLLKNSKNPKNSQHLDKAFNLVMYLDPVSLVDKRLKGEKKWGKFKEWERKDIKRCMIEEFDPEGKEKKGLYLNEIKV